MVWGSLSTLNWARDACKRGGVRREISQRPCDGSEERQREMREESEGYL
jgi:hypothetical protein